MGPYNFEAAAVQGFSVIRRLTWKQGVRALSAAGTRIEARRLIFEANEEQGDNPWQA